jgi:2-polyprenyl-3-methyl-5-hydroxy-6-metoxy-1,4-benzoquinol methylase
VPIDACPACGGELSDWRRVESAEPSLADHRFTLRRCRSCGTGVTVEPDVPGSHDMGAYSARPPRLAGLARPLLEGFDRRRLALLGGLAPPPARLLDAGAGRGRFVSVARAAGYDAWGIEPSERGVRAAAVIGVPVRQETIGSARVPPGSLDAVTLWHVLEHLQDPAGDLTRVASWLRPGGAVLVGVPNLGSLQARLCPQRWYHLDVPRHRVHFTVTGLHTLLARHGLQPVHTHHVLLEHNPFGLWQSLVSCATRQPSYLYNLLKHNARWRSLDLLVTAAALPLAPAAILAELVAGLAGRGGTIAVLARRAE